MDTPEKHQRLQHRSSPGSFVTVFALASPCLLCVPALAFRVPAARAIAVRVRAARLRAGRVVCLCSIRLDRRGGAPARALCLRCACLRCALALPMLALRVPAVRAPAVRARAVRLHVNCTGFPMTRRAPENCTGFRSI